MLGILGALQAEVEAIEAAMHEPVAVQHLGYDVVCGDLGGRSLALVQCGVGKVNAGLAVAALVDAGATEVVFIGVAGGVAPGVAIGDLVVASDLVQHDIDMTAMGYLPGQLLGEPHHWTADPALSESLAAAASKLSVQVHRGRIASGDQFIAGAAAKQIHQVFDALAVEMEGAAVAQAAARIGLPVAVARWISDSADVGAAADFSEFLRRAAQLDLRIIRELLT